MFKILKALDRINPIEKVSAHCDVPCGIYDPIVAQISALTVVRMVDLMEKKHEEDHDSVQYVNDMARYIAEKEEHAEKAKQEIRIIWGDFFKESTPGYEEAMKVAHKVMLLSSSARQNADRAVAVELVDAVNEFAELFWAAKNCETVKAAAPYAPNLKLVYRKIDV